MKETGLLDIDTDKVVTKVQARFHVFPEGLKIKTTKKINVNMRL